MSRRGHMSHKVPNVKLRPAPAPTEGRTKAPSPELWREAYGYGQDDDEMVGVVDENKKPWRDVVITITGSEDKVTLASMVKELGGRVESALTVHVTHVIASAYGSPKYTYAIDHRIPVLTPEWITDSHKRYIHDEEVNVKLDMEQFYLLPFTGLTIAMSGIEPLDRRRQLVQYINDFGGTYNKDLTRACTHLVAAKQTTEPNQSEKVKWALKENTDREKNRRKFKTHQENVTIIYEEWIWDCVGFRGKFPEKGYDASKPRPIGRVTAEEVLSGRLERQAKKAEPRKVERKEDDEPALIRKRKSEALDNLVGDIMSLSAVKKAKTVSPVPQPAPDAIVEAGPSRSSKQSPINADMEVDEAAAAETKADDLRSEELRDDQRWNDGPSRSVVREQDRKPSVLHMPRSTSFAAAEAKAGPSRLPTPTVPTEPVPAPTVDVTIGEPSAPGHNPIRPPAATPRFFDGLRFSHVIKENCESLEKALVTHGGVLIPEGGRLASARVDYVIVRLNSAIRPDVGDGPDAPTVVTECWIEGCCFERRMVSPDDHLVFRPLPASMPIRGAEQLNVHLSGWATGDTVYLKRLLRAIGAKHSLSITKETTHLVTPLTNSRKVELALEWGISVVKDTWLLGMGRSGQIEPIDSHVLVAPGSTVSKARDRVMTSVSGASDISFDLQGVTTSTPRSNLPEAPHHKTASSPMSSVSQSRQLKPTPTHIDRPDPSVPRHGGSTESLPEVLPLSAPGPERERALNKASSEVEIGHESLDSKISRTSSAPPIGSSKEDSGGQKRSTSMGGAGMTEALKQLAAKGEITPRDRSKSSRRPRTASRLKTSITAGHSITSISPQSVISPDDSGHMEDMPPAVPEGSVQVKYYDKDAERESRKLMALVRQGEATRVAQRS